MPELELNREDLEALDSGTRKLILKALAERHYNVSELSRKLSLSKSTVHAHLQKLQESGMIEKAGNQAGKWVFYQLSGKGKQVVSGGAEKVIVLLSSVFSLLLAGLFFSLYFLYPVQMLSSSAPLQAGVAEKSLTILQQTAPVAEGVPAQEAIPSPDAGLAQVPGSFEPSLPPLQDSGLVLLFFGLSFLLLGLALGLQWRGKKEEK